MFGQKKVTKEEKFENVVETAGLTGLLTEASTKLFKRLHTSKKGVGVMETANIISGSERNCLRTIVAQNSVIKDQNDLIIQLLAQIADNTNKKESGE
ncbi:hypothetical protein SG586P1_00049 [Streptococcus phage SG586P1]|nr:hypothetical protein SG586P1_00049 [Streptococcus phage SG586P1]WAX18044.1 hypothetical protein SG586P3_00039 [Streptococcus phage SG586P3]